MRPVFSCSMESNILVPRLISSGIKAPHCTTLHMVWNSSSQKARMTSSTSLVNSGSRRRYVRMRPGLKGNGGKAAGVAMVSEC